MTTVTRRATPHDAASLAEMLHAFNAEFDTETPGPETLEPRLRTLLAGPSTFAVLGGDPAVGLALVTLRPNVWSEGPVALLDEMYVSPEQRGSGVGSAILQHMVEICQEIGVAAIEINVDERMPTRCASTNGTGSATVTPTPESGRSTSTGRSETTSLGGAERDETW